MVFFSPLLHFGVAQRRVPLPACECMVDRWGMSVDTLVSCVRCVRVSVAARLLHFIFDRLCDDVPSIQW